MRGTTIRLAAPAIEAMLKAEPEMKVELQRCVVAEVVRRLMPEDLDEVYMTIIRGTVDKAKCGILAEVGAEGKAYDKIVQTQVNDACASIRSAYYGNVVPAKKRDEIAEAVRNAIAMAARDEIQAGIGTIEEAINKRVQSLIDRMDVPGKIEKAVSVRVDAEIERRVGERLTRIAEATRVAGGGV